MARLAGRGFPADDRATRRTAGEEEWARKGGKDAGKIGGAANPGNVKFVPPPR